jgi:hypothetical protein
MKLRRPQRNLVERETAKQVDPRLANELLLIRLRVGHWKGDTWSS